MKLPLVFIVFVASTAFAAPTSQSRVVGAQMKIMAAMRTLSLRLRDSRQGQACLAFRQNDDRACDEIITYVDDALTMARENMAKAQSLQPKADRCAKDAQVQMDDIYNEIQHAIGLRRDDKRNRKAHVADVSMLTLFTYAQLTEEVLRQEQACLAKP